jgi:hypothetical protein
VRFPVRGDRGFKPRDRLRQLLDGEDALVGGLLAHQFHQALGDIAEIDHIGAGLRLEGDDHRSSPSVE